MMSEDSESLCQLKLNDVDKLAIPVAIMVFIFAYRSFHRAVINIGIDNVITGANIQNH